jgi:HPt (histidine-containing phosphotransfer) domain-containing protein
MQLSQEESETIPSALDLAYLARQTLGDAGLEAELLRAFQLRAAGVLRRLRGSPPPAADENADLAHFLKGSARAVGAFGGDPAAEIYEMRAADWGAAGQAALESLGTAIVAASTAIDRLLGQSISDRAWRMGKT